MTSGTQTLYSFEQLPFIIGARHSSSNSPLPDLLPFNTIYSADLGLVSQAPNRAVSDALASAYGEGSQIGTPLEEQGLGKEYLDDFLSFLTNALPNNDASGLRTLEIGCGLGALSAEMTDRGAIVTAIEPGRRACEEAQKRGINAHRGFFPSPAVEGTYDLILHTTVMEHIEDPVNFLGHQLNMLRPGGYVAGSVPNCSEFLQAGDISIFVHEHWSYFSCDSLAAVLQHAGADVIEIRPGDVGGTLFFFAQRPAADAVLPDRSVPQERFDSDSLKVRFERSIAVFADFVRSSREQNLNLGLYCPARALNYLAELNLDCQNLRFFDDDPNLKGLYYPPFNAQIESRGSFCESPPDRLLIMSRSFGSRIRSALAESATLSAESIFLIDELMG